MRASVRRRRAGGPRKVMGTASLTIRRSHTPGGEMSTINADAAVEPAAARLSLRSAYGTASGAALALFVLMFGTWTPESPDVGHAGAAEIRAWASEAASTLQMN